MSDERLRRLDVSFVVDRGNPMVQLYLEGKQNGLESLGIARGDLQHYAAALWGLLSDKHKENPKHAEYYALVEEAQQKFPGLQKFRDWVTDTYFRQ